MIAGFVSIKIVARIIGPSGIALMGQFMNSIAMIGSLSTGAIGQGVTKYIAENYEQPEKQKTIIGHAVRITLYSTILMSLLSIIFYRRIGEFIFRTHEYDSVIVLFALTLCLYSFNMLLISILNGFKLFKKYIVINIVSSLLALAVSVLMVLFFGLYGALLSCVLTQTVVVVVTLVYVYKEPWFSSLFSFSRLERSVLKKLGSFGLMAIVAAVLFPLSQLAVRSYIADHISLDSAGIWEGMNRISTMYLSVITTSIAIFYLPRLSEIKEDLLIKQEVVKTAKIVLPVLLIVCFIIYLGRDLVIWALFSKEFVSMRDLFGMQMAGDFLKIASWLVSFLFWSRAMTWQFIFAEIFGSVSLVILSRILIDQYGLVGSTYAYALNYFIYLVLVVFIFRKILFHAR